MPSLALLLTLGLAAAAGEPTAEVAEESVRPGANEAFLAPELDVEDWTRRFESESREIYAQRKAIVAALRISSGMAVADIGAGTGLFLAPLAEAVGSSGRVYAVDLSPRFVEHLERRAKREQLEPVAVVLAKERSVELAEASIDLAFTCDTYHHFEYPRSTLASLHAALRPGGSLIVVDFERIPGKSRDWVLEHVRAGKEVFTREITAAGFELVEEVPIEGLVENYFLRFRRR